MHLLLTFYNLVGMAYLFVAVIQLCRGKSSKRWLMSGIGIEFVSGTISDIWSWPEGSALFYQWLYIITLLELIPVVGLCYWSISAVHQPAFQWLKTADKSTIAMPLDK